MRANIGLFVGIYHSVLAIFIGKNYLCFFFFFPTHGDEHTELCTYAACSVTRRKETQGEAAHLTEIQLSVSNGGYPGEEQGEADLE